MIYCLEYTVKGKIESVQVEPAHIRDAGRADVVMLNTFVPETFPDKTFATIYEIVVEKGKRTYKLNIDYRQS